MTIAFMICIILIFIMTAVSYSGSKEDSVVTKKQLMSGYEWNNRVESMLSKEEFEEVLDRRFKKYGRYDRPN